MSFRLKKCGILDTIQDLGSTNLRRFGINPGGVMDRTAARLLNILLGNDENSAVLEMHFPSAEILFEKPTAFAIGGADFGAVLDDQPLEKYRIYYAHKDSLLRFKSKIFGNRLYFAIAGGFQFNPQFNDFSAVLPNNRDSFSGIKLTQGDRFEYKSSENNYFQAKGFFISPEILPAYGSFPTVRVTAGAEFEQLDLPSRDVFFDETFVITNASNRMGYRLHGESLKLQDPFEMVSSAVNFGTIQLLPSGQLIVLMAEHQTSGGYPRIGNIIEIDLPLAAQLGANDKIGFHLITTQEAEDLLTRFETNLNLLKTAVKYL